MTFLEVIFTILVFRLVELLVRAAFSPRVT